MSYILIAIIIFCIFVGIMDYISYKSENVHINHWSLFSYIDEKYTKSEEKKKDESTLINGQKN
jgi:uncharacterized membrane protein YkgB